MISLDSRFARWAGAGVLCAASLTATASSQVELKIDGVNDAALTQNIDIYLKQLSDEDADGSERYRTLVQQTVDKSLRALGYYNSQYQFSQQARPNEKDLLTLKVTLDPEPVKIEETNIELEGAAKTDPDFINLVKTAPPAGKVLNHGEYDQFSYDLNRLGQTKGYFDAEMPLHQLAIIPSEHAAIWRFRFVSGDRYNYGKINFIDSQIRQDYLENILRIKTGIPYLTYDLSDLTEGLSATNWFSSVLVKPNIQEASKTVDLDVMLVPAKKNSMEIALGYETEVGARLRTTWKKPWLNDRGHSFEASTELSKPLQKLEFGYKVPTRTQPLYYYYELSGELEHENENDTQVTGAAIALQRYWSKPKQWNYSLGLKSRYDSFTQASDSHRTFLLYPTATASKTRTDGNRFPVWGDSMKLTLNWGSKVWGSDVNFYSARGSMAWIRTHFTNHRFYTRLEVGYIKSTDFGQLPPSLRFFAGGDNSIRGFGYKKVSPIDANGQYTGGSRLALGTFEYQYQVKPSWWATVFIDAGLAANSYSTKNLHYGAGVGVRWASPIGAVKFDVATPVKSPNNDSGFQIYLGLGSEL